MSVAGSLAASAASSAAFAARWAWAVAVRAAASASGSLWRSSGEGLEPELASPPLGVSVGAGTEPLTGARVEAGALSTCSD